MSSIVSTATASQAKKARQLHALFCGLRDDLRFTVHADTLPRLPPSATAACIGLFTVLAEHSVFGTALPLRDREQATDRLADALQCALRQLGDYFYHEEHITDFSTDRAQQLNGALWQLADLLRSQEHTLDALPSWTIRVFGTLLNMLADYPIWGNCIAVDQPSVERLAATLTLFRADVQQSVPAARGERA